MGNKTASAAVCSHACASARGEKTHNKELVAGGMALKLNRLMGLGVGLAVTGAIVKSTLYNCMLSAM